jgi:hypothetical protein
MEDIAREYFLSTESIKKILNKEANVLLRKQ